MLIVFGNDLIAEPAVILPEKLLYVFQQTSCRLNEFFHTGNYKNWDEKIKKIMVVSY